MSLGFSHNASEPAWSIQGSEKVKYENIFDSLGPISGKLSGDVVRPVLMNSKLPVDTLGKVWELSDIDKDGYLDKEEFCVAMHLVYRAIDKEPVPATLSVNLVPHSKRTISSAAVPSSADKKLPGAVAVLPPMPSSPALSLSRHGSTSSSIPGISPKHLVAAPQTSVPSQWVVSQADRVRFGGIFQQKKEPDGLISGPAARDVFLQSGLSQQVLAHVWGMCDNQQVGKLRQEQFVLAMHLISQKVKGIELPTQITPEMLSQSSLDSGFGDTGSISDGSSGIGDSAAMRELDALNQEIEELRREKEALTAEIQHKEANIKSVNNEVQELQDTLDRDSSSLAQLECDKAEAHTRLEELEQQRNKLDTMLADARLKLQEENENIKSLRAQISAQEASVNQQEADLRKIRDDLTELRQEETQLEQRLEAGKQQQENIGRSTKQAQDGIAQVQSKLKQLQEQEKNVTANIEQYDNAIAAIKSESNGDFSFDAFSTSNIGLSESVFSMGALQEKVDDIQKDISEDPFKDNPDPFKTADPFEGSDPFGGADPFASSAPPTTTTPSTDPFAGSDPFASSTTSSNTTTDPFKTNVTSAFSSDPFPSQDSSDPFSGQHPFSNNSPSTAAFDETTSSTFSSDPFGGSADVFSSTTNNADKKSADKLDTTTTSSNTSGKDVSGPFDTGGFAHTFSDNSKDSGSLFNDLSFPQSKSADTKSDPWGSAFGGSGKGGADNDPFGGDSFMTSKSGGSDPFGDAFGGVKSDKKAPPRPAKPDDMAPKGSTKTDSKASKGASKHHKTNKAMTEAEQLAWAQEESRKAEEERRRKQKQEQEDLELAIALSKQG